MTSSTYLSQQTHSTPGAWPGAQQNPANLSTPATWGRQGRSMAAAQSQPYPGTGRPVGRDGIGTQSPEPPALVDPLEHSPVDGWMIWVLFLLVVLGGLSLALLIGF